MRKNLLLLAACVSFLVSCTPKTYEDISDPTTTSPTYTENIEAVIQSNCVSCHLTGAQFPTLEKYTQVKDAAQNGNLICRISNNCGSVMPPSGALSQQTIDLIKLWQTQGYAN